jgi:hypothetical protein
MKRGWRCLPVLVKSDELKHGAAIIAVVVANDIVDAVPVAIEATFTVGVAVVDVTGVGHSAKLAMVTAGILPPLPHAHQGAASRYQFLERYWKTRMAIYVDRLTRVLGEFVSAWG